MEQLYYTWSTTGLDSMVGFRVRAASQNLADIHSEQYRTINPFFRYTLPMGTILSKAEINEKSPLCLTFADAGNKRILLQKVFSGDDAYGRTGSFFCHLLTDLGENFSAREAINLWHSPFWQMSATELTEHETSLPTVARERILTRHWNANDFQEVRDFLPFVIQAFLSLNPPKKLYILAFDWQVATLVAGLAQVLPAFALQQLTFSTYEYEVQNAQTRVVGTCRPMTPTLDGYEERVADLPSNCYSALGLALNCYTGKSSPFTQNDSLTDYASFATEALLNSNQSQKLTALLETANELSVQTLDDFLILFRVFTTLPQNLTPQNIMGLLLVSQPAKDAQPTRESRKKQEQPPAREVLPAVKFSSAVKFLAQENIQEAVIQLALTYPEWYSTELKPVLKALAEQTRQMSRERDTFFAPFANMLVAKLHQALEQRRDTALRLLDILLAIAPPMHNANPWQQMPDQFLDLLDYLSWEIRGMFLQAWTPWEYSILPAKIHPWLVISWEDMRNFFALSLPANWQLIAAAHLLLSTNGAIPRYYLPLDDKYRVLFEQALLKTFVQQVDPQSIAITLTFFGTLLDTHHPARLNVLANLCEKCPQEYIDALLERANLAHQEKVDLFCVCGEALLQKGQIGQGLKSSVINVATAYIISNNPNRLRYTTTYALCSQLFRCTAFFEKNLSVRIKDLYYASHGIWVDGYTPPRLTLEEKWLQALCQAIQRLDLYKEGPYQKSLIRLLVASIQNYQDLHLVLQELKALEIADRDSERTLFSKLATQRGSLHDRDLMSFYPYVAVALYLADKPQQPKREQFLKETFSQLFRLLDERDKDGFDQLNAATVRSHQKLPERIRLWQTFGLPYRPGNLLGTATKNTAKAFQQLVGWKTGQTKELTLGPNALSSQNEKATSAPGRKTSTSALPSVQSPGNAVTNLTWQSALPDQLPPNAILAFDLFLEWDIDVCSAAATNAKKYSKEQQKAYLGWKDFLWDKRHRENPQKETYVLQCWQQFLRIEPWIGQLQQEQAKILKKATDENMKQIRKLAECKKLIQQVGKEEVESLLSIWTRYWYIRENLPLLSGERDWEKFIQRLPGSGPQNA